MSKKIIRIIACAVFKPALDYLKLESRYPDLRVTYLPSNLHLGPQRLQSYLLKEVISAKERDERVLCLYGKCFPGIDDFCQQYGVVKVPGAHCYELLLGSERFSQIIEETVGTYFLEKELIVNFEGYCVEPLELHDQEMRKTYFQHYQRLLYIRQPSDPNLLSRAGELSQFLGLSLVIRDADYSYLEKRLTELL